VSTSEFMDGLCKHFTATLTADFRTDDKFLHCVGWSVVLVRARDASVRLKLADDVNETEKEKYLFCHGTNIR